MTDITNPGNELRSPTGGRLWMWWVLSSAVGWGVGGPLGVALGEPGYIIENGYMSIAFGGILTATLQWLALRGRFASAGWWAPAWVLGAVVFGAVVFGGMQINADVAWIAGASLFAPVAALIQWRFVLRRNLAGGSAWWVPACLLGFFAGGLGGWPLSAAFGLNDKDGGLGALAIWTAFGVAFGAVTGAALLKLLRRPVIAVTEVA